MDGWEVTPSHKGPITGEQVKTFHAVGAKTKKQIQKKRDELIFELSAGWAWGDAGS